MTPAVPKGPASSLEKNCKSLIHGSTQTSAVRTQLPFSHVFTLLANFSKILQGFQMYSVLTNFRKMIDRRNINELLKEKFIS